eukprot:12880004-Prorocentrum_lima.AAC.1
MVGRVVDAEGWGGRRGVAEALWSSRVVGVVWCQGRRVPNVRPRLLRIPKGDRPLAEQNASLVRLRTWFCHFGLAENGYKQ